MKTSPKDFNYFVKQCEYWKKRFHLGNWVIWYTHKNLGKVGYAQTEIWASVWKAEIRLNTDWSNYGDTSLNKKELDNAAKHEMLHCLAKYPEEELVTRLTRIII